MSYLLAGISILIVNIFSIATQEREPVIAVLPFKVIQLDRRLSIIVPNTVRISLIEQRKKVIRKDKMEEIFQALGISQDQIECNKSSCGVYYGRILEVDKAVVGEIVLRGEEVLITFSMIDIASTLEESSVQGVIKFSSNIKPYTKEARKLSYQLLGNNPPGLGKTDVILLMTGVSAGVGWLIYEQNKIEYGSIELIAEFP